MESVRGWSSFRGFCKDKDKPLRAQWTPEVWTKSMSSFKVTGWVPRVYSRRPGKNMAVRMSGIQCQGAGHTHIMAIVEYTQRVMHKL